MNETIGEYILLLIVQLMLRPKSFEPLAVDRAEYTQPKYGHQN